MLRRVCDGEMAAASEVASRECQRVGDSDTLATPAIQPSDAVLGLPVRLAMGGTRLNGRTGIVMSKPSPNGTVSVMLNRLPQEDRDPQVLINVRDLFPDGRGDINGN